VDVISNAILRGLIKSGLARPRMTVQMEAVAESGKVEWNSVIKNQLMPEFENMRDEKAEHTREVKFSGSNGDVENSIFPLQLTSRTNILG